MNPFTALSWIVITAAWLSLLPGSESGSSLSLGESLRDGATLVSASSLFELGFFSPGRSKYRYVGIWYYNFSTDTVLWVANRDNPSRDTSSTLTIGSDGNLLVLNGTNSILWTSNATTLTSNQSTVQLMDDGNLVLNNSGDVAWQSFDWPTDTYLSGMKVGLDLRTNVNHLFTSWRSPDDPGTGNFSMGIDPGRSTQIFVWEGAEPRWRSGRWDGQVFIGIQDMEPSYIYGFKLSNFQEEQIMYFYYSYFNSSHRYVLSPEGIEEHLIWKPDTKSWSHFWAQPITQCEIYNKCGNNSACTDEDTPICTCLKGYVPLSPTEWNAGVWSSGCRRRTELQCKRNATKGARSSGDPDPDGFWRLQGVKLPDHSIWYPDLTNESNCYQSCIANCSCNAFAFVSGIGCLMWGINLVDIHMFSSGGNDLNLRLAASELRQKSKLQAWIIAIIAFANLLLVGCAYLSWKCRKRIREFAKTQKGEVKVVADQGRDDIEPLHNSKTYVGDNKGKFPDLENQKELPLLNFDFIASITNNFSNENLLGVGGFGPVYKGAYSEGQKVAVKRLSRSSGQGVEEFKNEIILIAKLQHRNLVRLLGCSIEDEEKILIYEYMSNKSLDVFLFDSRKKGILDWKTRYNIVQGIARGLLYLHRDSRLRVIHRDLKASNILLDEEMNPKISDFGMARIFGRDDNETNTKRVVGTYGYMAPEYAMHGQFSVKSDVYSFGVLLLEIVSGKKNSTYQHSELSLGLLSYAWKLWNDNNVMEFVDSSILSSCSLTEVSRCVYTGLLCVQDRAIDRLTMPSVVIMLESGTKTTHTPKPPMFAMDRSIDVLMDNIHSASRTQCTER